MLLEKVAGSPGSFWEKVCQALKAKKNIVCQSFLQMKMVSRKQVAA